MLEARDRGGKEWGMGQGQSLHASVVWRRSPWRLGIRNLIQVLQVVRKVNRTGKEDGMLR